MLEIDSKIQLLLFTIAMSQMKESHFNKFRNFQYNDRTLYRRELSSFQTTRITRFHILGTLHFFFSTLCIHARIQNTEIKDHKNKGGRMLDYTMHGSSIEIQSGQIYVHRDPKNHTFHKQSLVFRTQQISIFYRQRKIRTA